MHKHARVHIHTYRHTPVPFLSLCAGFVYPNSTFRMCACVGRLWVVCVCVYFKVRRPGVVNVLPCVKAKISFYKNEETTHSWIPRLQKQHSANIFNNKRHQQHGAMATTQKIQIFVFVWGSLWVL